MKEREIRKLIIGYGSAKICVPIISSKQNEIIAEASEIAASHANIIEWRCDFYEDCDNVDNVLETLLRIRETVGEIPLIFTFRTIQEGGNCAYAEENYLRLYKAVISTRCVDFVDVELLLGSLVIEDIKNVLDRSKQLLILSNHDFYGTPPPEEINRRVATMIAEDADIAKISYMAIEDTDVKNVIDALQVNQETLMIGISMGELGKITRTRAWAFGSCITFASLKRESAPGQVSVEELFHLRNS